MSQNKRTDAKRVTALKRILFKIPGNSSANQCQRLLTAIRELAGVTTFEASRFLDIYYPPARVLTLRHNGYCIDTLWCDEQTESGEWHRVARYVLRRGRK
jgi:hypothetical protein